MTPKSHPSAIDQDTVAIAQIQQTLKILGGLLGLVLVIIPIVSGRLYARLDTIDHNTTKIAVVETKLESVEKDVQVILGWVNREKFAHVSQQCSPPQQFTHINYLNGVSYGI